MGEVMNGGSFVGYDYMEVAVEDSKVSMYLDCYESFGWQPNDKVPSKESFGKTTLSFKRNRKIMNKTELTRLQRNFDACMEDIEALEKRKKSTATAAALAVGLVGTAFVAGSVFAISHEPPIVWLCIILGVPGMLGWGLCPFLHKIVAKRKSQTVRPLIEQKYDEVYEVCEKGGKLLQ